MSNDVFGRELFMPEEVRMLDNRKCLILIRGFQPILDDKFDVFSLPEFKRTAAGGGEPYVHKKEEKRSFYVLNDHAWQHVKENKNSRTSVLEFRAEDFLRIKQM